MRKNYFPLATGNRKCDISGQGYLDLVTGPPQQIDKLVILYVYFNSKFIFDYEFLIYILNYNASPSLILLLLFGSTCWRATYIDHIYKILKPSIQYGSALGLMISARVKRQACIAYNLQSSRFDLIYSYSGCIYHFFPVYIIIFISIFLCFLSFLCLFTVC